MAVPPANRLLFLPEKPERGLPVAQVAGGDMSNPEKLAELDATYLKDMSLLTDLELVIATAFGAGRGDCVRT